MALTFIGSARGAFGSPTSPSLNVQAGDVIVGIASGNGGDFNVNTITIADNNGNNSLNRDGVNTTQWLHSGLFSRMAATANGTATFSVSAGASGWLTILQLRPGTGETASIDIGPAFSSSAYNWDANVSLTSLSEAMVIAYSQAGQSGRTINTVTIGGLAPTIDVQADTSILGFFAAHRSFGIGTDVSLVSRWNDDCTNTNGIIAIKSEGTGPTPIEGTASGTQSSQTGAGSGTILYQATAQGSQSIQSGAGIASITYQSTGTGSQSVQAGLAQGAIEYRGQAQGTQSLQSGEAQGTILYEATGAGTQSRQIGQGTGSVASDITGQGQGDQTIQSGSGIARITYVGTAQGTQTRQYGYGYSSRPVHEYFYATSEIKSIGSGASNMQLDATSSSKIESIKSMTSAVVSRQSATSEVI